MEYNGSYSMSPKLIRVGNSCYRRMDCDNNGIIDDFTHMTQSKSKSFHTNNQGKNSFYLITLLNQIFY